MPTRRMIDPAFWRSESMAELTESQRLLFIGLFSNADDQGRMKAQPALIRADIYPYDDKALDTIEADLQAIVELGSALLYEVDGKAYLQIMNWWTYQRPQWAYPSKFPAPPDWQDRFKYKKDNKVQMENWPLKSKGKKKGDAGKDEEESGNDYGKDDGHNDGQGDGLTHGQDYGHSDGQCHRDSSSISDSSSDSNKEVPSAGANAPPPPKPSPKGARLTTGQRQFLDAFGAKRFKTKAQKQAVLELEQEYGTVKLLEVGCWAAKKGMRVGDAVIAAESALPNWGKPKKAARSQAASSDPAGYPAIQEWLESKGVRAGD